MLKKVYVALHFMVYVLGIVEIVKKENKRYVYTWKQ